MWMYSGCSSPLRKPSSIACDSREESRYFFTISAFSIMLKPSRETSLPLTVIVLAARETSSEDLVDVLIDLDNQTNFLRHFLHQGGDSGLSPPAQRRNALAALIAIGCNIGPQRMAVASGL